MQEVILRFYEELNEHLPSEKRQKDFKVSYEGKRKVREVIAEQGVPIEEVDLVLVNGQSVDSDHVLQDGDRVSVYPVFERFDVRGLTRLRERPLRKLRFVTDKELGEVAARLRKMGLDVCCDADLDLREAVELSGRERRILLTSREEVIISGKVTRGIYVAPGTVEEQVRKIVEALDLKA
jgi:sulfur carrier protein ThiS